METLFIESYFVKRNKRTNIKNEYNFTCLDVLSTFSKNYYLLIQSLDEFKLKNVYHFLFIRSIHLHNIFPEIPVLDKHNKYITSQEFDTLIIDYINSKPLLMASLLTFSYVFLIVLNLIAHNLFVYCK